METIDLGFRVRMRGLRKGMASAGKFIRNFTKGAGLNLKKMGSNAESAGRVFRGGLRIATGAIKLFVTGITVAGSATVGLIGLFSKLAADFETGSAEVASLNVEGLDVKALEEDAKNVIASYGFGIRETWKGFYEANSRQVSNLKEFMKQAAQLSVGGLAELGTTVRAMTGLVNTFELNTVEGFQRVADVLNETKNIGGTTITDMASKLSFLAPTAKEFGISLEEVGAALAIVTRNGMDTAPALTGIRAGMNSLAQPGQDVKDLAEILGLKLGIAALKANGFAKTLGNVKTAANRAPVIRLL